MTFRELAQQMGMQTVRAILMEDIDICLNAAIIEKARNEGVIICDGAPFFVRNAPNKQIRLSFATLSLAEINTGIKIIQNITKS